MILDQLFEAVDEDSTAQRVAEMLRQIHPNPDAATEREILAATGRVLSDQGMSDVQVRFYLRDSDFQSDMIEGVQALLQGVSEKIDLGPRLGTKRDQGKILRKMRQSGLGEQGVAEAMKPSDVPPSMRDRLTMRDIEAERPAGAYRFRVTFPDGATADFMDFDAAKQRADADRGRISRLSEEKSPGARIERILKMLRAQHPQAENDLEALIFDFRSQQAQDRSDIARLDAENDMEEADIQRLERMLDLIKKRRGATAEPVQEDDIDDAMRDFMARGGEIKQEPARMPRLGTRLRQHGSRHIGQGREARAGQLSGRGANISPGGNKPVVAAEGLRDGEYHVATVTLDDGTVKKVRITSDEGFRDQIAKHFQKQGRTVQDIDVDYSVRSELDENKPTFTGAPNRPQQSAPVTTRMMPPAPGRPSMTGGPATVARSMTPSQQDLRIQETKKKPQPTNPELWSRAKAAAKSKFDVYPSAYANAWAAKWYKSKGGGWRMGKPKKD